MGFQTKHLVCMLLFLSFSFLFVIQLLQTPGCDACTKFAPVLQHGKYRRMVAYHLGEKKVAFSKGVSRPTAGGGGANSDEWELRAAPMGPDPIHHHGGGTKKPWTP